MTDTTRDIGPFVVGEKPNILEYTFLDSNGNPIDLSGYTVKFVYREQFQSQTDAVTAAGALVTPATGGKVSYTWTGNELTTPGKYFGEFWVGNNAQRYCSYLIAWLVRTQVGTVPNI